MSFQIDGADWTPKTTTEHTLSIMNRLNQILKEENIQDEKGTVIQLTANFANALYLLSLAAGNRIADLDNRLSQAVDSLNVEVCDDTQIQNLLPIAAISRNPGSYSTLNLEVTANADNPALIPAGTKAPYQNVNFVVKAETIVPAGETVTVATICDTIGPVAVLAGEVTRFDASIANVAKVENIESSIPGIAPETTNSLRKRIINGDTVAFSLSGVKYALEELTGIAYARVYFNFNNSTPSTLPGGVILQPRMAYIVVVGESEQIASTYCGYMNAPTQNAPGATTTAHTQKYVTASGQEIDVKYDDATEQTVYVRITLKPDAELEGGQVEAQLKRDLIYASSQWTVGEAITSMNTSSPLANITYTEVSFTEVSTDGTNWGSYVQVGCNVMPRVSQDSISVRRMND